MSAADRESPAGAGRTLALVYGLFALAAGARSAVQIATRFGEAPLAYLLSALAAAVYLVVALTISRPDPAARRVALAACAFELAAVLAIGSWSALDPEAFADQTVWWRFGEGYGYLPLILPLLGLLWLWRVRAARR